MSHHRKTFPHLTIKIGRLAEAKRMAGAIGVKAIVFPPSYLADPTIAK
ncbi:MAG: hypothetical protein GDA48_14015 [Hormoscilla sp. GM102CHS1]|nr:hypothetical protein [Hormoscilla sp. GM102CHS1]